MGMTNTLDILLTAIGVSTEGINTASQNIANANSKDWVRINVETQPRNIAGKNYGAEISAINSKIDEYIFESLRMQETIKSQSTTMADFFDKLNIYYGSPTQSNDLSSGFNKFFDSLENLATSPTDGAMRLSALSQTKILVSQIKTLSTNLYSLRLYADQQIKQSVQEINYQLDRIQEYNANMTALGGASGSALNATKISSLRELSKYLDISTYTVSSGAIYISTADGKSILDETKHVFEYIEAPAIASFVDDHYINPVVQYVTQSSGDRASSVDIISGGIEGNIKTTMTSGKLYALHQMRDVEIPRLQQQLDELVYQFVNNINAAHNKGGGYLATSQLNGSKEVSLTDERNWNGSVRISIVDQNGNPIQREAEIMPDGSYLKRYVKPLELNLSQLDSGNGAGNLVTVDAIMKEINEYFYYAPVLGRVDIGNGLIEDIKLVSKQSSTSVGGNFIFDFEIDNGHYNDFMFEVLDITVNNAATGITSVLPTAYNSNSFLSPKGQRVRSGYSNTVSFAGGGGGTYEITAKVRFSDGNNVFVSDVTYEVTDSETDALNKRYTAISATGDNTIPGTNGANFMSPSTTQRFISTKILNSDGEDVVGSEAGLLTLKSEDSSKYRIVIDDLTSIEEGNAELHINGTSKGFGHYFGLNNLFSEDSSTNSTRNSAYNLKIRSDIELDSNLMTIGRLSPTNEHKDFDLVTGGEQAVGNIELFAIPNAGDTITINGRTFTFVNGAPTASQIDISGGTIPSVITSMVSQLSASNSINAGFIDIASYSVDPTIVTGNAIKIELKTGGSIGNNFSISANLSVNASINAGTATTTPIGNLQRGNDRSNTKITKSLYTYSMGRNNTNGLKELIKMRTDEITFASAGTLPSMTTPLIKYSTSLIGYNSSRSLFFSETSNRDGITFKEFESRYREGASVTIDEEIIDIIKYQATYAASAKAIATCKSLLEGLLVIF